MSEPKVSDLLRNTFGPFESVWVERNGVTTTGKRPAYLDQPFRTAAEMVTVPDLEQMPKKRGRK